MATAGDLSDGELRPLPVLPGRMHLVAVALRHAARQGPETLRFADLAENDDPSLVNEQLVVTVDAQLFYTVLQALPYLVQLPVRVHRADAQPLRVDRDRVALYREYPAVARMAKELSSGRRRSSVGRGRPEPQDGARGDAVAREAKGGDAADVASINVLDPRIARRTARRRSPSSKKAQTSVGGFPWLPGGPPSPYMTLYILYGFAKARVRRRGAEGHGRAGLALHRAALPRRLAA